MTTERNIIIHQGQAFELSLDYAGTAGRGQRMHIRLADSTATVVQILTHNGDANASVIFDTDALDITIGASVSAGWVVLADRVEWVYDIEDYDLADEDDCVIPYRGKVIVRGNRTRASDVTPSDQMPSGDGRYVRFDGVQGLSAGQQLQARENIGAGTGGGSSAWGAITGTLTDQTDLTTALGLKAPLASPTLTGTPAAPTAAGGTSTTQIATTAFAAGEIATHAALTTGAHGITAAGAALLDDATAADQRTTLGLGTAATAATSAFEAAGAISTHNAVTTAHGISAFGATLVDDADAATARATLGLGTAATSASGDFATAAHTHSGVYQPADAELTAIAGLTSAADKGIQFTGSGTAATFDLTAAGRAILDDADASAQRTTLGLAIGTNVQAYDADLTTWAGITPGTGVGTALGTNVGTAGSVVTSGGALGTPSSGALTNCTFPTLNQNTSGYAEALKSATTTVSVSAATAPSSGQVLTATSGTAATWQTPAAGSPGGSDTHVQYNDAGAFGGEAAFTYNKTTDTLTCKVFQAQKVNNAPLLQNGTTSADACLIWVTGNELQAANGNIDALIPFQASVLKATQFQTSSYAMASLNSGLAFGNTNFITFANATCHSLYVCGATGDYDTALTRDAAGALNQRNSTNAQTFRVTRSYTDGSNYSWLTHKWNTSTAVIHAEGAGTGSDGSVAFNDAALATNATVGFLMIPSCAGTPSGTPADIPTGQIPLVWDSTNLKLYAYTGGAWKASAAFT